MAQKRSNPLTAPKAAYDTTGMDPEMIATLGGGSTLGKQAAAASQTPKKTTGAGKNDAMAQWERVDKARAIKGLPSLPKPGSKETKR